MKRLLLVTIIILIVSYLTATVFAAEPNKNNLPESWKFEGKKRPIVLEYEYSNIKGTSYLRGFVMRVSEYRNILKDKQLKLQAAGIPIEQLSGEEAEMYNELVDLSNKGVIGLKIALFTDLVSGAKIEPDHLLITFDKGKKSCTAVGIVYFDIDKTDTELGKALVVKKQAPNKPLQIVIYVPDSFSKPYSSYPPEQWVTKITITSSPANPVVSKNTEKGR